MHVEKAAWKAIKNTLLGASLLGMVVLTMIAELVKLLLSTFQLQEKKERHFYHKLQEETNQISNIENKL